MPNTTDITGLPVALAVDGTEDFPLVQGGTTKRAKTGLIMAGSSGASVQDANTVFAGPVSAPAAAPSFRALVPADIPNGLPAGGDTGQQLVKLSDDNYDVGWVDDPAVPEPANTVLAGPTSGPDADPTFRALVNGDLPTVDVSHGGSGRTSSTAYAVLCGGTTSTGAHQSIVDVGTTGQALLSNGPGALPTFQSLPSAVGAALTRTDDTNVTLTLGGSPTTALLAATSITAGWTGTLAATRGGTGYGSYAVGDILYASTTTAFSKLSASTTGYLLQTNGAGTAPTWVGYLNPGSGASVRTWSDKNQDITSVLDFIPESEHADIRDYTSTTDVSAYIQAAVDAQPASGCSLYFPPGIYCVGTAVELNKPGLYYGACDATCINTLGATNDAFDVTAEFITVDGFKFTSSVTKSGGQYIDVGAGANRTTIRNYRMEGAFCGIRTSAFATVTIEAGMILSTVATTGIGIRVEAGYDVSIRDLLMGALADCFAGIYVNGVSDLTIEDVALVNCGTPLSLDATDGKVITSVWATNSFFDTSVRGCLAVATGTGVIARCLVTGCWFSSHTTDGVYLATVTGGMIDGFDLYDCHIFGNSATGVTIADSGVLNVNIGDSAICGNGTNGVTVGANVAKWSITNSTVGSGYGWSGNNNGIVAGAGVDNFRVLGNNLLGNTVASLSGVTDNGTTKIARFNLGATDATWTVAQGGTGLTSGTSGGVPYFNSSSTMASSAALTANALMTGGGAGSAPSTLANAPTLDSNGNLSVVSASTGTVTPVSITGTSAGGIVRAAILNNTSNNTSQAQLQLQLNIANVSATSVLNGGSGSAYFQFLTGSATPTMYFSPQGTNAFHATATAVTIDNSFITPSLQINQAASSIGTGVKTISNAADSSTNFGKYFSFSLNGVTVYVPCGTAAPT